MGVAYVAIPCLDFASQSACPRQVRALVFCLPKLDVAGSNPATRSALSDAAFVSWEQSTTPVEDFQGEILQKGGEYAETEIR